MRATGDQRPFRRRTYLLTSLAVLALAAACADGGSATDGPVPDDEGSAAATDAPEAEPATDTADAEAPAASSPSGPASAEDGWNGTDDLDPVGPGAGRLQVGGETIDLEVTCTTPGPLDDHGLFLFAFDARGDGVDSQGRDVYVEVKRRITVEPEGFYDYDGHETGTVQTVVALGGDPAQFHSAIVVSPADADSAGQRLPLVRVAQDGTFTVVEDVPAMMMHDEALAGPTELVGTCPDSWPDDASQTPPLF